MSSLDGFNFAAKLSVRSTRFGFIAIAEVSVEDWLPLILYLHDDGQWRENTESSGTTGYYDTEAKANTCLNTVQHQRSPEAVGLAEAVAAAYRKSGGTAY